MLLVETTDADFEAMLGGATRLPSGLALPPGGVDERQVLQMLRHLSVRLRADGARPIQMMIADDEVVGTCGFKTAPPPSGEVEIGYGVAPTRRRLGHATRAVAELVAQARRDVATRIVTAETAVDNVASQRVLAANGFERDGTRVDPHDGRLLRWRIGVG